MEKLTLCIAYALAALLFFAIYFIVKFISCKISDTAKLFFEVCQQSILLSMSATILVNLLMDLF